MVELRLVEGVGTATLRGPSELDTPPSVPIPTPVMIEDAMTEVVEQCAREGITDSATILQRKLTARARVMGVS